MIKDRQLSDEELAILQDRALAVKYHMPIDELWYCPNQILITSGTILSAADFEKSLN